MKTIIVQGRECDTMILMRRGILELMIVIIALVIVMPVSAATESFTISDSQGLNPQYAFSYAPIGTGSGAILVNTANIGTPSTYVSYFTSSGVSTVARTSDVTYSIGGTNVGTGSVTIANGTFSGLGNMYVFFTFNNFDVSFISPSTTVRVNLTCNSDVSACTNWPGGGGDISLPTNYMSIAAPGNYPQGPSTNFYVGNIYVADSITLTSYGNASASTVWLADITKTGTSVTRIYKNGTLYYTGSSDNSPESPIGVGGNVRFSMYVPSTSRFANSSLYIPYGVGGGVTPTPTPLPTLTPTPDTTNDWDNPNVLFLSVLDAMNPSSAVGGASVGIKNLTSGTWKNTTTGNGYFYFTATGTSGEYILGQGETVIVAASANGYDSQYATVTINGKTYTKLYLTSNTQVANNGGANFVITCTRNDNGEPVAGANVYLQTGVNGPCSIQPGCNTGTNDNGIAYFYNVSASTSASVRIVHQAYQEQTKVLPVTPNATNQFTFSLVRIGWVPVVTPVATTTTLVNPKSTITAVPVLTNANGQIITTSQGKVDYSFGMLIDVIPDLMGLAIGIVEIWFLWLLIYILTGGKIIDKLMRRGRGRGR